jgi:hypothetical protein
MERKDLPQYFVEDVKRILEKHVGLDNAIKRSEILAHFRRSIPRYQRISDRQIRDAIGILRDEGVLICSLGNDSDGYFIAARAEEYLEFRPLYAAHMQTMILRLRRMDAEASKRWGARSLQPSLL